MGGGCPTTENLAEYLEGGLPPERRLRLEEHLAGCPDCCTSFAQSTIFLLDEELARDVVPAHVPYAIAGNKAAGLGIVLVATGALLWSFQLGGDERRRVSTETSDSAVATAALDYAAPRLTGGRRWAELAAVAPAPGEWRRGYVEAAMPADAGYPSASRAAGAESGLGLGAAGVAELLAGGAEAAVASLLRAAAVEPESAELRSDLGAAFLARASQGGEGEDLPEALESIESALAASPRLPEALFNRALALEQLHLPASARQAWRAYLDLAEKSGGAGGAGRRIAEAEASVATRGHSRGNLAADGEVRAELAAAGAGSDATRLAELGQAFRGVPRRTVSADLLPGRGPPVPAGDGGESGGPACRPRGGGKGGEAQTADPSLRAAIEEVELA